MQDAFLGFEWPVASVYEWQDWLDTQGRPVVAAAHRLAKLESLPAARGAAVERVWRQLDQALAKRAVQTGPVLNPLNPAESQRYRPMQRQHAALFREFAEVEYQDRGAILAFASRYGLLGIPAQRQTVVLRNEPGEHRYHSTYGESHFTWAREICYMREAVRLSDHQNSFERLRRLKWLCERHLRDVHARLAFDGSGQPRLAVEPVSLITAMWLQLSLALTGAKRFVACKFCRHLFEISTEQTGFRSHREFCSDSCKTKDYRRRKRTALKLGEAGVSLVAISKRVDTSKATVRNWLAGSPTSAKGEK